MALLNNLLKIATGMASGLNGMARSTTGSGVSQTLTPQSVKPASSTGGLSAGGNLNAGKGPVVASTASPSQVLQQTVAGQVGGTKSVSSAPAASVAPVMKSSSRATTPASTATAQQAVGAGLDDNGEIDWSKKLTEGMSSGADSATIQAYLDGRNAKIAAAGGALDQYLDDPISIAAQAYIKGHTQPTYPVTFDSYQDLYDRGGYAAAEAKQQELLKAQMAQLENYYGGQRGDITSSAEEQARQAYIAYMQSLNTMPQAMAASGYSGGLADSQRLALDLGYQNNRREILQSRDTALNDLTTALNDARLQTTVEGVQAQGELMRDAISAYQNWANQQNSFANQDFWTRYGYDQQAALQTAQGQQSLDNQLALLEAQQKYQGQQQDVSKTLESAQALAASGDYSALGAYYGWTQEQIDAMNTYFKEQQALSQNKALESAQILAGGGDYSALGAYYGWTPEQISAMNAYFQRQQATASRSSGSNGTKVSSPSDPYAWLANQGVTDEGKAYGLLLARGYSSTEALNVARYYVDMLQGEPELPETVNEGIPDGNFNGLRQAIHYALQEGDLDKALGFAQGDWDKLSDSQKALLVDFFNGRGYKLAE